MGAPKNPKIERAVTYTIYYRDPTCIDWGDPWHDEYWESSFREIEAKTDKEAQLLSLGKEFRKAELCYHGRHRFPTRIEKKLIERTVDGWERITTKDVALPRSKKCPCGHRYWPVKGEKACHKLTVQAA